SAPKPQPDGSLDPRKAERRRADALETILDLAARGLADTTMSAKPAGATLMLLPADTPDLTELEFMGSITVDTAKTLSCDTSITMIVRDHNGVPLNVGREKRL
ncbi:HNH endonuclease, partial [Gordonia sp. DT219]